ncbi:MAG: GxxExxY protein [Opitutus sp.]|nr:GxxExxY protein [Opitutus sp.]MCS6277729.1 GxxExxY protein [Opitutus sp.]MCS6299166.1 GxxExxY protein [Opitutus sp.]
MFMCAYAHLYFLAAFMPEPTTKREEPYTPDLLCYDKIIVELKAAKSLAEEHRAQVINYLKVTGLQIGLLVNFGSHGRLEWERIILSHG